MKELSIEEKARAYDKALERAQALYNDKNEIGYANAESVLEEVFPLLKESEDERIRKELIVWLKNSEGQTLPIDRYNAALAWLEKQGEMDMKSYKAAEDEKREFVGDGFIKCYADFQDFKEGETYWLEYVGNDNYNVRSDNLLDKTYHITPCQLYTIFKKMTWLEKQGEKPQGKSAFEAINEEKVDNANKVEPKFKVGDWIVFNGLTLYINEVVQGYYRTISIGGIPNSYDWDIDNVARLWAIQDAKEGDVLCCESGWTCIFKALHDKSFSSYCFMDKDGWFCDKGSEGHTLEEAFVKAYNGEIYPATNEQRDLLFEKMKEAGYQWDADKKELKKFHIIDEGKAEMDYCFTKMMNGEKVSSAWSEKDEEMRLTVLQDLQNIKESYPNVNVEPEFNWLKSIKDRAQPQYLTITDEELVQAKKEAYNDALDKIEYHSGEPTFDDGWSAAIWYLKKKNAMPQTQWKPSDEQMEVLKEATSIVGSKYKSCLNSLYSDLKKLKD